MAIARPLIGLQVAKEEEPAGPSVLVQQQIRVRHGQSVLGLSTLFWNLEGRENLQDELMALVGEQFDETKDIRGIVASVRQRGDKLALWTRTASNEAVQDDSRKDKSSRGGRYTV